MHRAVRTDGRIYTLVFTMRINIRTQEAIVKEGNSGNHNVAAISTLRLNAFRNILR